jgi:hypothetical protein
MTDFILKRLYQDGGATIGRFSFNANPICWSLEDIHRDIKIPGQTRIPAGRYRISKITAGRFYDSYNERWGHEYALGLEDVEGFTHIRIHTGNNHTHTEGCILTGASLTMHNTVTGSRGAYEKLYDKIRAEFGECDDPHLTVVDD